MKPPTIQRLMQAADIVRQICNISGVPSTSIGILQDGEVLFKDNFGYRNVASKMRPTSNTLYGIASLTKGFVAASLGKLLDEQSAGWLTPLKNIDPDFKLNDPHLYELVSIADFLSHRTGLSGDMSIALQGGMEVLLQPEQLKDTIANLQTIAPFRQEWRYNNWGYSVAGSIIESLANKTFLEYVKEAVLDPLNLTNTTSRPEVNNDTDFAEAYAALQDSSFHLLPRKLIFRDSVFEAAGGMYSTVNDLLRYCKAVLEAEQQPDSSPLRDIRMLLSNQIPLDNPSRDYRFYGFGWIRTQLPGVVGLQGTNAELFDVEELPILGRYSPPMMAYYHQGSTYGYYSAILLLPETQSAVVVLTNSIPLNDAADWIVQVYASALFGFRNPANYVEFAMESRKRMLGKVADMKTRFEEIRRHHPPAARPLEDYVCRYYNRAKTFIIEIKIHRFRRDHLELWFQGRDSQIYDLRHLQGDTFEWSLEYDESARRARFPITDYEYFVIDFHLDAHGEVLKLRWGKRIDALPDGMEMISDCRCPAVNVINFCELEAQSVLEQ
jgi:CubicO group peptidase (beta-lactamase class C family)